MFMIKIYLKVIVIQIPLKKKHHHSDIKKKILLTYLCSLNSLLTYY